MIGAAGQEIALFRIEGNCCAIEDSGPHAGASLVTGTLDKTTGACRAHGLRFDLATGCLRGPPGRGTRTFPVQQHQGRIQIDLAPPGA